MLREQRLKREYSGRVWESKNISSRVLSAISIVKKNWEGKESHLGQERLVRRGKSADAEDETNNSRTLSVQRLLDKKLAFGK